MAAAAALVTTFVTIVVTIANTAATRTASPPDSVMMRAEMISPRPLFTTMVPNPIDPAMMARMFQFSARAADRGVSTRVSTMRVAPAVAINSTGASPNELDTITAARMASAAAVLPVCGALPATFCHSPTTGCSASMSADGADTRHLSPGLDSILRSERVVSAATTMMSSSACRSWMAVGSSHETDTRNRSWRARPNRGLPHSIRTPSSLAR